MTTDFIAVLLIFVLVVGVAARCAVKPHAGEALGPSTLAAGSDSSAERSTGASVSRRGEPAP